MSKFNNTARMLRPKSKDAFASRRFGRSDKFDFAGKDPAYRYRLIKRAQLEQTGWDFRGWEPVAAFNKDGVETPLIKDGDKVTSVGTSVYVGDLILACMPEEWAKERESELVERTASQLRVKRNEDSARVIDHRAVEVLGDDEVDDPNVSDDDAFKSTKRLGEA